MKVIKEDVEEREPVTMVTCQLCGNRFPIYNPYKPMCICDDCRKLWEKLKCRYDEKDLYCS